MKEALSYTDLVNKMLYPLSTSEHDFNIWGWKRLGNSILRKVQCNFQIITVHRQVPAWGSQWWVIMNSTKSRISSETGITFVQKVPWCFRSSDSHSLCYHLITVKANLSIVYSTITWTLHAYLEQIMIWPMFVAEYVPQFCLVCFVFSDVRNIRCKVWGSTHMTSLT